MLLYPNPHSGQMDLASGVYLEVGAGIARERLTVPLSRDMIHTVWVVPVLYCGRQVLWRIRSRLPSGS